MTMGPDRELPSRVNVPPQISQLRGARKEKRPDASTVPVTAMLAKAPATEKVPVTEVPDWERDMLLDRPWVAKEVIPDQSPETEGVLGPVELLQAAEKQRAATAPRRRSMGLFGIVNSLVGRRTSTGGPPGS
jgi:hypothetical protein